MDLHELKREIAQIDWWHQIDLGNGIITPGRVRPDPASIRMPEDLTGKTVLDIGAADGFHSFEAERRGATRVVATSLWGRHGYVPRTGFDLARRVLNSRVEGFAVDVIEMSPDTFDGADVVLLLGVLYHLRHPLLALERVFSLTRELLILESHVDLVWTKWPVMRFYPGSELNQDPTNWWGPNPAAIEAMLKDVGFRRVEMIRPRAHRSLLRAARKVRGRRSLSFEVLQQDRAVFHAWR